MSVPLSLSRAWRELLQSATNAWTALAQKYQLIPATVSGQAPLTLLAASDNDQRLGIYPFVLKCPLDDAGQRSINIRLLDGSGKDRVHFEGRVSLREAICSGIQVQAALLDNGGHVLEVNAPEDNWRTRASFVVDEPVTPRRTAMRSALLANGTPAVTVALCDSKQYPFDTPDLQPWFETPNAEQHIQSLLDSGSIDGQEADGLRQFVADGYVVIENVIPTTLLDRLNGDLDDAVRTAYQGYKYGSSNRIEHLHRKYDSFHELWLSKSYRRYVDLIFGEAGRPCQTLTFLFGSQQDAHQDSVHLTPFPEGMMCGVWVSLQDIVPESGELVVYPGSHREPRLRMASAGCSKVTTGDWSEVGRKAVPLWQEMTKRYPPVVYRPKAGTVLIWHENLLHEGSRRADDSRERRSVVIHCFSESCVAFYDSTGQPAMAASKRELALAT